MTATMRDRTTDQQAAPEPSGFLSLSDLTNTKALRIEECVIPGRGTALMAELLGSERDELDNRAIKRVTDAKGNATTTQDYRGYRALACVFSLRNADRSRMFPDASPKDVQTVNNLPTQVIDAMFAKVDSMSLLTKSKQESAGKDSSSTTGEGSASS